MKKITKKIVSMLLATTLIISICMPSLAFTTREDTESVARELWIQGPDLPEARTQHDTIEVNGQFFVGPSYHLGNNFLIYDIATNSWIKSADAPQDFTTFVEYENIVYCFSEGLLQTYDIAENTWTEISLDFDLNEPKAILYEGKIVLVETKPEWIMDKYIPIYFYEIETGEVNDIALYTNASYFSKKQDTAIIYDDVLYIFGMTNLNPMESFFGIALNGGTSVFRWNSVIFDNSMNLYDEKIYITGSPSWPNKSIYDIKEDEWYEGKGTDIQMSSHTATLIDDKIYAVGGNSCLIYDIETDEWSDGSEPNYRRFHHTANLYDDKLYVIGGETYSNYPSDSLEILVRDDSNTNFITYVSSNHKMDVNSQTTKDELESKLETKYPTTRVTLSNGENKDIPVEWDVDNSNFDSNGLGIYKIKGNLDLSQYPNIQNTYNLYTEIDVKKCHFIEAILDEIPKLNVEHGASEGDISQNFKALYPTVKVLLDNEEIIDIPVDWGSIVFTDYHWGIYGYMDAWTQLDLSDFPNIGNSQYGEISTGIYIHYIIYDIEKVDPMTVPLGTTTEEMQEILEREHYYRVCYFGDYNGGGEELVRWDIENSDFDGNVLGEYTLKGEFYQDEYASIPVINLYDIKPEVKVTVISGDPLPTKIITAIEQDSFSVMYDTPFDELNLKEKITVYFNYGYDNYEYVDVIWNEDEYNQKERSYQEISGELILPYYIRNYDNYVPTTGIFVDEPNHYITNANENTLIETVEQGTSREELKRILQKNFPEVEVTTNNGYSFNLPVDWQTEYGESQDGIGSYIIWGDLVCNSTTLPDEYLDVVNYLDIQTNICVYVVEKIDKFISAVETSSMEIDQNLLLEPTDKENSFEYPTTVETPDKVLVSLTNGDDVWLPVSWDISTFKPEKVGVQTITGSIILDDIDILNPDDIEAELKISVNATDYEVWGVAPDDIEIEVLPGTSISEINKLLLEEGKREVDIMAISLNTDDIVYMFSDYLLKLENNTHYDMDTPGEYTLVGTLPDNLIPFDEDFVPLIKVIVSEPLEILYVNDTMINSYQSVEPEDFDNIPNTVEIVLEGGIVSEAGVIWNWDSYNKNAVGENGETLTQFVEGELILPSNAKHPEDHTFRAIMAVYVEAVDYEIVGVTTLDTLEEDMFTADAGLTLEEITNSIKPRIRLELKAVSKDLDRNYPYDIDVVFEDERNEDFIQYDEYIGIVFATLQDLPSNIECDENYELFFLQTIPVEAEPIEAVSIIVKEGTLFEDIDLPETVPMKLISNITFEEIKTAMVPVDFGNGDGYNPCPDELTEDTPVTFELTGYIADSPDTAYINRAGVDVPLKITVTMVYTLTEISPSRFPLNGTMKVNLGTSIEEIYTMLDTYQVDLTLTTSKGDEKIIPTTFELREEDNLHYDINADETGIYTLKAHLPLDDNIINPNDLSVEIVVETMQYNVNAITAVRITGVIVGTPFDEVGLPELVTVTRSDSVKENVPVSWDESTYRPAGTAHSVSGILEPLPKHLKNPNNRKAAAMISFAKADAEVISMKQIFETDTPQNRELAELGFTQHLYEVKTKDKNGAISTDIISTFVEL